jgi:hypothetical protein
MKSELSDDLLRAIGAVSAQWAVLEYEMSRATVACLKKFSNEPSERLNNLSFKDRRVAFGEALSWPNVTPSVKTEGSELLARIKRTENDRHEIIHGMAEEFDVLQSEVLFSRIVGDVLWFNKRFTVAGIEAIADRIGELRLDIFKFAFKLWPPPPPT